MSCSCSILIFLIIKTQMLFRKHIKIITIAVLLFCALGKVKAQHVTADSAATPETTTLYQNLFRLMEKGVMYGHQEDLAYGVGWEYQDKRSDVKDVTGSYPAVYGWDVGRIEADSILNLDGVPFQKMVTYIQEVYKRGGINTISWHMNDPVTSLTSWSTPANSVKLILQNHAQQTAYKAYLDKFARYVGLLKSPNGEMIPVIFRPFHESTGTWFWWGSSSCTAKEYIALWKLTYNYLVNEKKLHNLLFAYSSSDFSSISEYNERYPGDAFVDIVGFDAYCENDPASYETYLANRLQLLYSFALEHNKLPALTEFGYNTIPDPYWWTQKILPAFKLTKLSYALTWRNWKEDHFFSPYPGQISADNFKAFYKDDKTIFQKDMKKSVYKKPLK